MPVSLFSSPPLIHTMSQQFQIPKEHKAAVCEGFGKGLVVKTVPTPQPKDDQVLIKVAASGICFSDHYPVDVGFPGVTHPITPGHEVVGRIVAKGSGVSDKYKVGQMAGLGWSGGYCTQCTACRHGDFWRCEKGQVTGVTIQGGHQEYVTAHWSAVVEIPEDLGISPAETAPLLCAGLTVNDALNAGNAKPGDSVVISGIGGLGHIAIQFARKSGYHVIVVSGSEDKRDLAMKLGAHTYYSAKQAEESLVKENPNVTVAVATAPSADAISGALNFLGPKGKLVIVGLPSDGKALTFNPAQLVVGRRTVQGLTCGCSVNNEELLQFAAQGENKVKAIVQKKKLDEANEAYLEVVKGKPKFRNVIVFDE